MRKPISDLSQFRLVCYWACSAGTCFPGQFEAFCVQMTQREPSDHMLLMVSYKCLVATFSCFYSFFLILFYLTSLGNSVRANISSIWIDWPLSRS